MIHNVHMLGKKKKKAISIDRKVQLQIKLQDHWHAHLTSLNSH